MTAKPMLFEDLPRSRPRFNRGYVIDCREGDVGPFDATMRCAKCSHEWRVTRETHTELVRGIPCPKCNTGEPTA